MFAIADCNNFYASCEKVFNPSLRSRPVLILSNNDGCVIARSAEAKALGIPMGAPAFKLKGEIERHNMAVFSSNYALYGDMSQRVMNTLARFTPSLEIYSIDEAFLSLEGFEQRDLVSYGHEMRRCVSRNIGIEIGVGIAPTKTLAKAANNYAKKSGTGVWLAESGEDIERLLRWLPIEDVWGIGRKHARRLQRWQIETAYDFVNRLSEQWVQREMSIVGVRTWKELRGISCITLEQAPPAKQSIATTRSFGRMVQSEGDMCEAVASFAASCAGKLRRNRQAAQQILVFIHTNPFRSELAEYCRNRVITLPVPSSNTLELVRYALIALRDIFREGYYYKKAGVVVSGLVPEDEVQQNFLDTVDRPKQESLMNALDRITLRFGKSACVPAITGQGKRRWHMNQQRLSPCYTTRWDHLMEVKV